MVLIYIAHFRLSIETFLDNSIKLFRLSPYGSFSVFLEYTPKTLH